MMKAIVKCIKSNGEEVSYIVADIIDVVYTNKNITLVKNDGTSVGYSNAITDGYKYIMSIF